MNTRKRNIALVAHDNQVDDLLDWAQFYRDLLAHHNVYATGSMVDLLSQELDLNIIRFNNNESSVGDRLSRTTLIPKTFDLLVLFWDFAELPPNDPDIQALLKLVTLGNVPIAGNRTAADVMFPSYLYRDS